MSTTANPTRADRRGPRLLKSGVLRNLLDAAVTPLTVDDILDHFAPLRPGAAVGLQGRIEAVLPETADAATIVIKPGKDWAGHVPGQYVRIGVDVDGVRLWRTYSLTHGPRRDGNISITVKAIPDGTVSNYLVRRARVGQMVRLEQAEGEFVLPQASAPATAPIKLMLVTAGSGITPVIGMLRNLFSRKETASSYAAYDVVLVHSAMSRDEVIFGPELRQHAAEGRIRLIERHTDTDGLMTTADLESWIPDLADRTAYACGPAGLLDTLEEYYGERGLTLHTERFRPTVLTEAAEGGTVTFRIGASDDKVVEADGAVPILDAGESAGVLMPSGCRMGICMGCVLPMKSGVVRDLRNGELTVAVPGETNPDGVDIQTCINAAAGDCDIDLGSRAGR
jgi:ferredoxin-NADP reductase